MLKISIITVTFNNVKTIEQTIKSVLDPNYSNLEYIVIDGGSKDGALEILNKYKNKFNYFKSSPDEGVFDAMNKGISEATGDLIGFVNGDDLECIKSSCDITGGGTMDTATFWIEVIGYDFDKLHEFLSKMAYDYWG